MNCNRKRLIVCGTDTDVGKTIVSSLLVQGLNAVYWKPIQSGLESGSDTQTLRSILQLPKDRCFPEAYQFQAAVSPHWAAEKECKRIDPTLLQIPSTNKPLIIETAGGLMVPLNRQLLQIDQLQNWGLPIVLVARSGLGTLNHTLLSVESLRKRNIPIIGIFLNGPPHQDNPKTISEFSDIPILAQISHLEKLNPQTLQKEWEQNQLDIAFEKFIKN